MKLTDKLKRQRYDSEMKLIELEELEKSGKLNAKQEVQMQILKKMVDELTNRINNSKT